MKYNNIFLGFDPGGKNGFGAALLAGNRVESTTVSSVGEALEWSACLCGDEEPSSAGIDSLLHWSDGPSGWRPVDKLLRSFYPAAAASVISPNGLYGSMAIGGMALALRLRERWHKVLLNETHPKLLVPALGGVRYADASPDAAIAWFGIHAGLDVSAIKSGHELDALISAWVTRKGLSEGWVDLVGDDPSLIRPAGAIRYLWPVSLTGALTMRKPVQVPPKQVSGSRGGGATTAIGFVSAQRQKVVRKTDIGGNLHGQRVYVLRCLECGHEYGANGSDIWLRRCPQHDGGAPGLKVS